ncbi:MAG: hypothetical protein IT311_09410 [Anaerolineales bacterium]|nr:hypothetical protein [Anaerolineales bacterium]MCZ2123607.1 hypothetical protein [Anaerolineales bacterium]
MNLRKESSRPLILWGLVGIFLIAGIITLIFAFRGKKSDTTDVINLAYTSAALTFAAQESTLQAALSSATPNTAALTPTATVTPLSSPTLGLPPTTFATITPASIPVTKCDNAVYMADVTIPDGTVVAPGGAFTKTWRISNAGTCTWSATYQLVFISGELMGGKATPIGKTVAPGQSLEISVALIAPTTASANNIQGTWRLQNDSAQQFGDSLTVVIKVGGATGTPAASTVTPTNTSAIVVTPATPTPTIPVATATPTDTLTLSPTDTPGTPGP